MDWVREEERWDWRNSMGDSHAWGWKLGFSRMIKFPFRFVLWHMHRCPIKRELVSTQHFPPLQNTNLTYPTLTFL